MAQPWRYQIRVQGRISERWMHSFEDMDVRNQTEPGARATTLSGDVADQAALFGVLQQLYTLGLPLSLVRREEGSDMHDTPTEQ